MGLGVGWGLHLAYPKWLRRDQRSQHRPRTGLGAAPRLPARGRARSQPLSPCQVGRGRSWQLFLQHSRLWESLLSSPPARQGQGCAVGRAGRLPGGHRVLAGLRGLCPAGPGPPARVASPPALPPPRHRRAPADSPSRQRLSREGQRRLPARAAPGAGGAGGAGRSSAPPGQAGQGFTQAWVTQPSLGCSGTQKTPRDRAPCPTQATEPPPLPPLLLPEAPGDPGGLFQPSGFFSTTLADESRGSPAVPVPSLLLSGRSGVKPHKRTCGYQSLFPVGNA